jgi:hypothetical protein
MPILPKKNVGDVASKESLKAQTKNITEKGIRWSKCYRASYLT